MIRIKKLKKYIYILVSLFCLSFVQTKPAQKPAAPIKHKFMIIPFEGKMYMSLIDHKFNQETKQTQKQIKADFRKGTAEQVTKKVKDLKHDVLNLMSDTVKYGKDIRKLYQFIKYSYDVLPDQNNYIAPAKEKKGKAIDKGQIVVETNAEKRFMNADISTDVLKTMETKYKTDVFIFINQIDITSENVALAEDGTKNTRTVTLHYTVFNSKNVELNSGTSATKFPNDVNKPEKVISDYISKLAKEIADRANKALVKEDAKKK